MRQMLRSVSKSLADSRERIDAGPGFLIAGFASFRTATFIHEIVHMRKGLMPGFRLAWNVLFGVPMLTPSLLYSNHLDHHRRRHYGTKADGEYQPFERRSVLSFARYFGQVLVLPLFALARFMVIGALSYLHPGLRRWTIERFSSYVSNFRYRRVLAPNEPFQLWLLTDIACFACALGLVGPLVLGLKPWTLLARFYLLAVFTNHTMNRMMAARSLAAILRAAENETFATRTWWLAAEPKQCPGLRQRHRLQKMPSACPMESHAGR